MSFSNRIRLPFYLSKPQYPADEEVYLKSNGTRVVLHSIINKEFEGMTDWIPQQWHERLTIALRHDTVNVENVRFNTGSRINGSYEIDWQDFLDYPLAPAKFKAFAEAFVARSNRCETCEELDQLIANDDLIAGTLNCGGAYQFNPTLNDSFCCSDPVFTILSYNTTYIDTISIDNTTGVVSFTLKSGFNDVVTTTLFTYQVQCEGETKTASVDARISCKDGGDAACAAPANLQLIFTKHAALYNLFASWNPAEPAPACDYHWQLTIINNDMTETLVATGTTALTSVEVPNLLPKHYRFTLYADCCNSHFSEFIFQDVLPTSGGTGAGGNDHMNKDNYSCAEGSVTGECGMEGGSVSRTAGATSAATAANQCARLTVRWFADSGCSVFATYDFQPTDTTITGIAVNLDCMGACSTLGCEVISVELISC